MVTLQTQELDGYKRWGDVVVGCKKTNKRGLLSKED